MTDEYLEIFLLSVNSPATAQFSHNTQDRVVRYITASPEASVHWSPSCCQQGPLASQLEDKSREVDIAHQRQVDAEYVVEELRDQLRMARDLAKLSQKQADYNSQRMSASNTSVQTTMVD